MKQLPHRFGRLRLNQKFTLVIFCVVLVPVMLLTAVLFSNMQSVLLRDKIKDLEAALLGTQADVEKAVELCSLTTQFYLGHAGLADFLRRVGGEGSVPAQELIRFYREDVGTMERLVNANPYLYQVRIYQPNGAVPEIMPILYHQERMRRLAWGYHWTSGTWQLDYVDTIFPDVALRPVQHIMSLVTAIEDPELGQLAVLEVGVRMDEVLPGLYKNRNGGVSALLVGDRVFAGEQAAAFWDSHTAALAALFDPGRPGVQTVETRIDGERALVASAALEPLGGSYLSVVFHSEIAPGLSARVRQILIVTLLLLLLLVLSVNLLVKAMLRRFYLIVDTVARVREGNLSVAVPDVGDDEIGVLGDQFARMLERIQALMQENVDRQLLAKNAEIKALQSQINAHFIYNVLESIKMLAEVDERYEIADALASLGKLLRYSMRWTSQSVTLSEEVEHIRNYLALIDLRFDYRITLRPQMPDELLGQQVPKMILQPIVENAVVHGIEELDENTVIEIEAARRADGRFDIVVTDHGRGIEPGRLAAITRRLEGGVDTGLEAEEGIGLKNVHDRIVMTCGPGCGLWIESEPGRFTRVRLRIPIKEVSSGADEGRAGC